MEEVNQPPQNTLTNAAASGPESKENKAHNPWKLIMSLNRQQKMTFIAAFLGWTLDAFDYFIVILTIPYIAKEFKMEPSDITASITVTLCFRPLGAAIFGLLADRYGRRYPLMIDIILYSSMELASGFAPNFSVFIILRAIFGVAMGGEWGLGAALAMEILPPESRGLFSGILQQGYATGYLLASILHYAVIENIGWRAMFWIGSFPALLVIILRFFVPESPVWKAQHNASESTGKTWLLNTKLVLKHHWRRFIYCVLLMACFNFLSHGTQDLYPTFLKVQLGYTPAQVTILTVVANIGAIIGGTLCGYTSQLYGRKLVIIISAILTACFVPLYLLPRNLGLLMFGAFALYFCVQGAWGVVPAHLNELSPSEFRGTFPGLTYQLGNLISSSSAQIEAKLGERFKKDGSPNYGLIIAILTLIVVFSLVVLTLFSKEYKDIDFIEQAVEQSEINNEKNEKEKPDVEKNEKGEVIIENV
ncbi:major facilitator superfamily domain-containing protein [Glomus cerebriforme]|uniref:Major facilitator superfamily domain-containing protein n=1 Tax=Glomus cerebriforme TaxID=658196 RepID=A0A397SXX3_9GLOM|nr:major facilitator superfamily domain-containing protein [Glomus cerebriforme]